MNFLKSVLLLSILFITACGTSPDVYRKIDLSEKTMKVPVGNSYILGDLKNILRKRGWKLIASKAYRVKTEHEGEEVIIGEENNGKARYRLHMKQKFLKDMVCFVPGEFMDYEITLIDSRDGMEIMSMSDKWCSGGVAEDFVEAMYGED